ncbi:MAG: DUF2705 family protein [Oscillospiraceae bacterium]|nr:DUF2705 family protein [Candidatus Limimonas egerieequi]
MKRSNYLIIIILTLLQTAFFYQQGCDAIAFISGIDYTNINIIYLMVYSAPIVGLLIVSMDSSKMWLIDYGQLVISRCRKRNKALVVSLKKISENTLLLVAAQCLVNYLILQMRQISQFDCEIIIVAVLCHYLTINALLLLQHYFELTYDAPVSLIITLVILYFSYFIDMLIEINFGKSTLATLIFFPNIIFINFDRLSTLLCLWAMIINLILVFISQKKLKKIDII